MSRRLVVLSAVGSAVAALAVICVPEVKAYRDLNAITRSLRDPADDVSGGVGATGRDAR